MNKVSSSIQLEFKFQHIISYSKDPTIQLFQINNLETQDKIDCLVHPELNFSMWYLFYQVIGNIIQIE